jgi:GTP pyrophosphokinase
MQEVSGMETERLSGEEKMQLDELLARYPKSKQEGRIMRAFEFADRAHQGQIRKSGRPYITHPLNTAVILSNLGMDSATIIGALLHDVLEDTDVTREEVESSFGSEVALLVDGVTKLKKLEFRSKQERQMESFRKMFLAIAKDIRVLIIKLADRLHNMRTLDSHSLEKQKEISKETLEIYAPLAHRLGMFSLKNELEDLSLKYMEPDKYRYIAEQIAMLRFQRDRYIQRVIEIIRDSLMESGVHADIKGRPKHYYSIYRKMIAQDKDVHEIYDLIAVRAITDTIQDCYAILGIVHALWKPIPGRFKDFIAMPKNNMYQSIHTTVMGPEGEPFEIQIRTVEMHRTAEYGSAAHWKYKEGGKGATSYDERLSWIRQTLEWQSDVQDSEEFIETLKLDMFEDIVFVFTPQGDVIELPAGSVPIDFAYRIHSAIGHRCVGCKINGKINSLDHPLTNGDIVEIMTSRQSQGPKADWLSVVKTSQARAKIRQWFKKEKKEENIQKGRELLEKEIKKLNLDPAELFKSDKADKADKSDKTDKLLDIAKRFNFVSTDDLLMALGNGDQNLNMVMTRVKDDVYKEALLIMKQASLEAYLLEKAQRRGSYGMASKGIRVRGVDDVLIRLSRCCNPLPGDPIIGYITRGRGVSIHRVDCPNACYHTQEEGARIVDVAWESGIEGAYVVELEIYSKDRARIASDIMTAVSDLKVPIHSINARGLKNGMAMSNMKIEIKSLDHLNYIIARIMRVKGVDDARRVVRGRHAEQSEG